MATRTRAGSPTVWLEVTYQGLEAPTDLFADLQLIGWTPPTIAPPPHTAIDWSRPNEATGERFTLLHYTVDAAVVQPPGGSGARGAWTDAERSTHLAAVARVLARHAATVEVDDDAGVVAAAQPTTAPAEPVAAAPSPAAPLPPPPAPAAAVAVAGFTPSTDATAVLITAPIKPSLAPSIEDALVALGVTAVFDNQERLKVERYRASTYETTVTELHVATVVPPDQLDAAVTALHRFGLELTFTELDEAAVGADPIDPPEAAGTASPATTPADGPEPPTRTAALARVVALADPRAGDAVAGVIRSLGLIDTRVSAATRTEVSRYRGSRSEREVPALQVEVWVPEPHALLVANHLAEAARLRLSDTERIWIDPPAAREPVVDLDRAPAPPPPAGAGSGAPASDRPAPTNPSSSPPNPSGAVVAPRPAAPLPTPDPTAIGHRPTARPSAPVFVDQAR